MPLIITPPLPLPKPSLGLDWSKLHWYKIDLEEQEAVIINTMKSTMKIDKEREALENSCKKVSDENKNNILRMKNCINKFKY